MLQQEKDCAILLSLNKAAKSSLLFRQGFWEQLLQMTSSTQKISASVTASAVRYSLMEVELELELEVLTVFLFSGMFSFFSGLCFTNLSVVWQLVGNLDF